MEPVAASHDVLEIVQEWVDDLRSGKFKQGKGRLRYRTKEGALEYCCLGVLGERLVEKGICKWEVVSTEHTLAPVEGDDLAWTSWLPTSIRDLMGLQKVVGLELTAVYSMPQTMESKLTDMNDAEDKDFFQIADYIQQELLSGNETANS